MAVERAKRIAERGGDAIVIIDGLDALQPAAARRVFGAARNTEEAGSLTIVAATGSGGELQRLATTRVVLAGDGGLDCAGVRDAARGSAGRLARVGDPGPGGLGGQLDQLVVAVRLRVAEACAWRRRRRPRARPPSRAGRARRRGRRAGAASARASARMARTAPPSTRSRARRARSGGCPPGR